ncbi:DUF456 domain-containing protein [Neisseria animalis]|uniref:DUF456 family protein n=1 Tax=Neisseria animalis TaxID=492 RepID=A0A5P3MSW8_NEIAN|nr:DUF456 family protein [Neisseria animalis]QEY24703.1 DUF456 family protein [Neisseria animalis]ROW31703.1 DUF456 family protein [Neisseria animalis]VEE07904.1 Membrane protein [Neisseria animalis]
MTVVFIILGLIAVTAGLLGTIYPAIPGLGLMFGGAWLLAHAGDYQIFGSTTLIFLAIVAVIGTAMDYVAGMLGAKYTGADKLAVWGAFIGGIAGAFFSLPGLLFGPMIGAAVGEFITRKDMWQAGKVSFGTLIGFIIGTVAKIGCALTIVLTLLTMWIISWFA